MISVTNKKMVGNIGTAQIWLPYAYYQAKRLELDMDKLGQTIGYRNLILDDDSRVYLFAKDGVMNITVEGAGFNSHDLNRVQPEDWDVIAAQDAVTVYGRKKKKRKEEEEEEQPCDQCQRIGASGGDVTELNLNPIGVGSDIVRVWQGVNSFPNSYYQALVSYREAEGSIRLDLPAGSYIPPFSFGFSVKLKAGVVARQKIAACVYYQHNISFGSFGGNPLAYGDITAHVGFFNTYYFNVANHYTFYRQKKYGPKVAGVIQPAVSTFPDCGPQKVSRLLCLYKEIDPYWTTGDGDSAWKYDVKFQITSSNIQNPRVIISQDSWIKIVGIEVFKPTEAAVSNYFQGIGGPLGERECYCGLV